MERDEKKDYLIELREKTGLNRKDFAIEFDIPYPTITDWERGNRRIPEYFLKLLDYKIGLESKGNCGKKEADNPLESDVVADEKYDCGFTKGNHWFRYRAAGIILEEDKTLFVTSKSLDYFYTVGGGVHMGETSEECVKREVFEETGVHYELDHLAVIVENFFSGQGGSIDGKDCHCLELYYLMKPTGSLELNGKSINADNEEEILHWIPVSEIQNNNIKPSFLKERFDEIIHSKGTIHIVTDIDRVKC